MIYVEIVISILVIAAYVVGAIWVLFAPPKKNRSR